MSKPVGDACRKDGTLKDASEIEWFNSPTEYNRSLLEDSYLEFPSSPSKSGTKGKRKRVESNDSESDERPRAKVSFI